MASEPFENFYKQLNHTIERKTHTLYPIMGIIHNVSPSREYADVRTEHGIISNIPAHGFPVIGDSCIIHFINGNIEQPVCDCARREAPPEKEYLEMLTNDCLNYLPNGDFNNKDEGFSGNFELLKEKGYVTTGNYFCELRNGHYIEFTCDISQCKTKYFKFQANMRGNGLLKVECLNPETNKLIHPVPENLGKDYSIWVSDAGRFGWAFNKEAYLREEFTKVKFKLSNITEEVIPADEIAQMQVGEVKRQVPHSISVDGLLVYDENGDTGYYWNEKDVINSIKQ